MRIAECGKSCFFTFDYFSLNNKNPQLKVTLPPLLSLQYQKDVQEMYLYKAFMCNLL